MLVKCDACGKEIKKSPSQIGKHNFCCKKCEGIYYKKPNEIIIKDTYAEVIINSPKYGLHVCLIDIEDIDKIKQFTWRLTPKLYAINKGNIKMHRIITDCPQGLQVDHIDKNKLNNRKCNLRICDNSINSQNRFKESKNISKNKNVYYEKNRNTWRVRIMHNGVKTDLGSFPNTEQGYLLACNIAEKARREYHEGYVY